MSSRCTTPEVSPIKEENSSDPETSLDGSSYSFSDQEDEETTTPEALNPALINMIVKQLEKIPISASEIVETLLKKPENISSNLHKVLLLLLGIMCEQTDKTHEMIKENYQGIPNKIEAALKELLSKQEAAPSKEDLLHQIEELKTEKRMLKEGIECLSCEMDRLLAVLKQNYQQVSEMSLEINENTEKLDVLARFMEKLQETLINYECKRCAKFDERERMYLKRSS